MFDVILGFTIAYLLTSFVMLVGTVKDSNSGRTPPLEDGELPRLTLLSLIWPIIFLKPEWFI